MTENKANMPLVGWAERERAVVAALKTCPIPSGCTGRFLEYDFATGQFKADDSFGIGAPCPLYGSACGLGRAEAKKRANAICERIGHLEFLRDGILTPQRGAALELIDKARRPIVILAGGTGRGKDFAIAHRIIVDEIKPRAVHWFTAMDLVIDMATNRRRFDVSLHKNAVCVIEDAGTEPERAPYGSGESAALIGEALAKWIGRDSKIYISTNRRLSTLCDLYGDRAASRLRGLSDYLEISDAEPDFRQHPRAENKALRAV